MGASGLQLVVDDVESDPDHRLAVKQLCDDAERLDAGRRVESDQGGVLAQEDRYACGGFARRPVGEREPLLDVGGYGVTGCVRERERRWKRRGRGREA